MVPAARAPLTWPQQLEAFDNYLYLIYGPSLLVGGCLPRPAPSSFLGLRHHPRPACTPRACTPGQTPSS